ncbi:MAG: PTS sugar transporter subunit IIA [Neomegalonema sp.]|nr:PTS sugar transporter subunit IIA [Neomegalonema sp.]
MDLTDLTPREAIFCGLKATSKKQLLQELSHRMAPVTDVDARELLSALLERERLGTTGAGRGVAIPHCRLPQLKRLVGCLARLDAPVDFESIDGEPVDLVYVIAAPASEGAEHLKALARVSRIFRDDAVLQKLRGAKNAEAMHALLAAEERSRAA